MLIVVDQNIPFAVEAFTRFGEVRPVSSRALASLTLRDADALIVRSVTQVNAALLDNTKIHFVGSATAGTDHIDLDYLKNRGIAFASAPGSNANAVAEYVAAALLHLNAAHGLNLAGSTMGIIGCGHVGRRVARVGAALGMPCVINDPPLARATSEPLYRPIEDALACDVVTVHVPLERSGADPTYHLINERFLAAMKPSAFLINTSRGAVADTAALKQALVTGKVRGMVSDVWENEPAIDVELAGRCLISTAHIAGHTLDAKIAAVQMLADAFAARVGTTQQPIDAGGPVAGEIVGGSPHDAVRAAFDIVDADRRLRDTLKLDATERARVFDALRAERPARREFAAHTVVALDAKNVVQDPLRILGFRCATKTVAGRSA